MNKSQYLNAMCRIAYKAIVNYLENNNSFRYEFGFDIKKFNRGIPVKRHLHTDPISFKEWITYDEFRQKFDAEIFRIDNERSK